jgi:cytochrome c
VNLHFFVIRTHIDNQRILDVYGLKCYEMPYIPRVEPMACLWQKWAWDVAIFMTAQSEGKPSLPEDTTNTPMSKSPFFKIP